MNSLQCCQFSKSAGGRSWARPDKGGATIFKVGGTSSRAERAKKIVLTPHFWLTWGDIKQDITVFITANYDV